MSKRINLVQRKSMFNNYQGKSDFYISSSSLILAQSSGQSGDRGSIGPVSPKGREGDVGPPGSPGRKNRKVLTGFSRGFQQPITAPTDRGRKATELPVSRITARGFFFY